MAELPGPALFHRPPLFTARPFPPPALFHHPPLSPCPFAAAMAEPVGPFHLLRAAPGRFLCYCGPDGAVYGARRRSTARCSAVETLASSCSPEKNAARSQQLFLPGRRCQGHLPWSCSLVSSPPWRLLVLYPCALQDTRSALGCGCWQPPIVLVLFRAEQGQGSMWWLSGCLGCSGQRLGIASLRRAGFAVLLDWRLWQVHGSFWERRPSLALPCALWLLVLPGWAPAGSLWPWRDWQGCQSSWLTCDLCPACS
ncbi:protein PAXX isoform X4 [Corvus kubaryi]|uniref:protein PAXX isoform X4 n=2 Tax=Corvus TaxID=30420 RepID=UPI001C0482A9|nr:protein PAXX isoform X4 [Corvus kubaryi]